MSAAQVRHGCDTSNRSVSSSVNEVIRAVLNLLFFLRKDLTRTKSTKAPKAPKAQKGQKSTKKHKNANKRISNFFPLRCFYAHKNTAFFVFVRLYVFLCLIKLIMISRVLTFTDKT